MAPARRAAVLRHVLASRIALVVLSLGAIGMKVLVGLREPPRRQVVEHSGPLVRVVTMRLQDVSVTIHGFGTVRARHMWSMVPEVSGPISRLSPNLRAGMQVRQGELLFEIDPQSYPLAGQRLRVLVRQHEKEIALLTRVRQNHANTLALARRDLAIADEDLRRDEELARRGAISTRERNRRRQVRNDRKQAAQTAGHLLALTDPQIEQAEAALAAARTDLESACLQLDRTRLLAPFDGQISINTLERGEFAPAGQETAAIYDVSAVEIPVSVPLDELRWLPVLSPQHLPAAPQSAPVPGSTLPSASVHWRRAGRH